METPWNPMEFSYVFAHVARKLHDVFHTKSHGIFSTKISCVFPPRNSMGYKTGTPIYSVGSPLSITLTSNSNRNLPKFNHHFSGP